MIQGFVQCYVIGFLLTVVPRFTRTPPVHPLEIGLALVAVLGFGAAALAGQTALAQIFFLLGMLVLLVATGYRLVKRRADPPEEFLFVAVGLALGFVGGLILLLVSLGVGGEPAPGFGLRLVSLGMVLTLVLGVGGILVPGLLGIREDVIVPRMSDVGERFGRLGLYIILGSVLILAFIAEAAGHEGFGFGLRTAVVTILLLFMWRIYRRPRKQDLPAHVLWISAWGVLLGIWVATLSPLLETAGLHLMLIAGFGVMTMAIATRITVVHSGGPVSDEQLVLTPQVVAALTLALVTNLVAHIAPVGYVTWLAASGIFWMIGWILWAAGAVPRFWQRPSGIEGNGPQGTQPASR
jgi:uncharacterized protein involved in response to NO